MLEAIENFNQLKMILRGEAKLYIINSKTSTSSAELGKDKLTILGILARA